MVDFGQLTPEVLLVVKAAIVIGFLLYDVFAFVIVRQVMQMSKTLKVGFEAPIKLFSYLHLFFALGLTLLSVIIL